MSSPHEDPLIQDAQGCQTSASYDLQALAGASQAGVRWGPPSDNVFSVLNTVMREERVQTAVGRRTKKGGAPRLVGPLLGPSDHFSKSHEKERSSGMIGQMATLRVLGQVMGKGTERRNMGLSSVKLPQTFCLNRRCVERREAHQQKTAGSFWIP